jgi:predicted nucleotidyltransferase
MRLKYYLEGLLQKRVDLVMRGAIKKQLKTSILGEAQYV